MSKKMTLTLEFGQDVPDDRHELLLTVHARQLALAIGSIDEYLRSRAKYATLGDEAVAELHAARDRIREELGPLTEVVFG